MVINVLNFYAQGYDGPFQGKYGFHINLDERSYKFYTTAETWESAKRTCKKDGATLAVINSQDEENVRFF